MRQSLFADALAVPASWPAARPPLAFLQLLLGPAHAAFSRHLLLGVLHPADELVASQRRDVLPSIKRRRVGDQRDAQVCGSLCTTPPGTGWLLTRPRYRSRTATHSHAAIRYAAPRPSPR